MHNYKKFQNNRTKWAESLFWALPYPRSDPVLPGPVLNHQTSGQGGCPGANRLTVSHRCRPAPRITLLALKWAAACLPHVLTLLGTTHWAFQTHKGRGLGQHGAFAGFNLKDYTGVVAIICGLKKKKSEFMFKLDFQSYHMLQGNKNGLVAASAENNGTVHIRLTPHRGECGQS